MRMNNGSDQLIQPLRITEDLIRKEIDLEKLSVLLRTRVLELEAIGIPNAVTQLAEELGVNRPIIKKWLDHQRDD